MKTMMSICFILLLALVIACEPIDEGPGGEDDCDSMGTLKVTNSSDETLQRLMIDGVNYGLLEPGESKSVDLPEGYHNWQLVGISGGGGCNEAMVIITECNTSFYKCNGK